MNHIEINKNISSGAFKQHTGHPSISFLVVKDLEENPTEQANDKLLKVIKDYNKSLIKIKSKEEEPEEDSIFYSLNESLYTKTIQESVMLELDNANIDFTVASNEPPFHRNDDTEAMFYLMENIQTQLEYCYTQYVIQGLTDINSLIFKQLATNIALKSGDFKLDVIFMVSEEEYKQITEGYKAVEDAYELMCTQLEIAFLERLENPFQKVNYLERLLAYKPK